MQHLIQYLLIFLGSTIKIVFGMVLGTAFGFNIFLTGTITILGMMTSVYIVTFFGTPIRSFTQKVLHRKKRKLFSSKTRRSVRIWQKYGVAGIAFLTPIILMPIGGAILANAFGGKKTEIFKWMWISCIFWTYPLTWIVKFASHLLPFGQDVLNSLSSVVEFFS